jgi:hypothetical protein
VADGVEGGAPAGPPERQPLAQPRFDPASSDSQAEAAVALERVEVVTAPQLDGRVFYYAALRVRNGGSRPLESVEVRLVWRDGDGQVSAIRCAAPVRKPDRFGGYVGERFAERLRPGEVRTATVLIGRPGDDGVKCLRDPFTHSVIYARFER